MAASNITVWSRGFSENPAGARLSARSIIEMLDLIGDELVSPPGVPAEGLTATASAGAGSALGGAITRRELLARVVWTRAIMDADGAATKLIIEYLDGKPGEAEAARGEGPAFCADDYALAEALLQEGLGHDDAAFS